MARVHPLKSKMFNIFKNGGLYMKEFILIAIALFNIYNNGLVIMRSIENCGITWVMKGTDGLCESEEDVVRGISRDYSFVGSRSVVDNVV
jgi:hypothetical protein